MKLAEPRVPTLPDTSNRSSRKTRAKRPVTEVSAKNGRSLEVTDPCCTTPAKGLQAWRREAFFRVNSLVGQVWLQQLRKRMRARYAKSSGAARPALQTGYAWRSFSTFFEPHKAIEWVRLFENLLRFANYEGYPPARSLFLSYAPLAFEHDLGGEYIGPGVWSPLAGSKKATQRIRRTLQRWCDWLEALTHFQIHLDYCSNVRHRDLDKAIIFLWPLLKTHYWTNADLLSVLRAVTNVGAEFPCQSERQLAAYCQSALGLRNPRFAKRRRSGAIPGKAVAERVFNFLPAIA